MNEPGVFVRTHGYFEIAAMIGFLGAIFYAIRLRRHRKRMEYAIPFYLNTWLVALAIAGGTFSFIHSLFNP